MVTRVRAASRAGTAPSMIVSPVLPDIAALGFDVLYFPPDPSDRAYQPQRPQQFAPSPEPDDPGSLYAIGTRKKAAMTPFIPSSARSTISGVSSPPCASMASRSRSISRCNARPDHPWLKEHPDWFELRPDGSIRYAENPPKKYEDIVNPDFYGAGTRSLWAGSARCRAVLGRAGLRIFRVDNPHTKPFAFGVADPRGTNRVDPDVVFLAEAFTRPKIMKALAKLGFSSPTPISPGAPAKKNYRPI